MNTSLTMEAHVLNVGSAKNPLKYPSLAAFKVGDLGTWARSVRANSPWWCIFAALWHYMAIQSDCLLSRGWSCWRSLDPGVFEPQPHWSPIFRMQMPHSAFFCAYTCVNIHKIT
jgi:hypothetical protein